MFALLTATLLAATSSPPDAGTDAPAADEPALPTGLELVLPERMIEELLASAAPFDRELRRTVSLLGMSQDVKLAVRLKNPRVRVTPSGIHVTLDYSVGSASGLGASGSVRPRLELEPDEKTGDLVAKLVDATLTSTGVSLPLDQVVDPIRLPASAAGPLQLGGRSIDASGRATKVILEEGRVRVLGVWTFRPAATTKREQ